MGNCDPSLVASQQCSRRPAFPSALLCLLLSLSLSLLLCAAAAPASAQLPGQPKPEEEFEPVIPNFSAPSADWWTGWPDASPEQRQQWLEALQKAWADWQAKLPDNKDLQARAKAVTESLKGIENTRKKFGEYRKMPVLPEVKFPEQPNVLNWADADAAIARGLQRQLSLQLELRQLSDTMNQSINRLRQQVVVLREAGDDQLKREAAALALLQAQLRHLIIVERRDALEKQQSAWKEQIGLAQSQLARMLKNLQYSDEVGKKLDAVIKARANVIDKLTVQRSDLQADQLTSANPEVDMARELKLMQLETEILEAHLKKRKAELLQSINDVLKEDGGEHELIVSRELLDTAHTMSDSISRDLAVRQRQLVAWTGEERAGMQKWWLLFEKINSGLGSVDDLINDVQRYEAVQLQLFKKHQGWWPTVRERTGHFLSVAYRHWRELADYKLFTISENPITLRDIAKIIFVLVVAWLISSFTRRFLQRLVRKNHASESSMYNLGRVLHYSIIAIALIVVLSMLGLDTSKLALVAGALSVGIGFGMQAIFSNFISGLILLFEQPLRVGDLVELESGVFGRIRDINVRSTRITTRDNVDILVPNTEFVAGRVINHTLDDPVRRIHVPFGVAYGSDPDNVREAAMAAAERVAITHTDWQRKTEVWLMEFGDSSLNFKLVVWINSNMVSPLGDPYALFNLELLRELNEREIEVPFPQRDLHVRSWEPPLPVARYQRRSAD
ncbi:mechanosensitive ion channel domain-containing protein [Microbulbifer hainanensis]|uniref:mechanosensitive ion channel domain-containing protein n=1 Tax=Microbulbifer hainanensis TaxID=2735675 RepID=UPI001868F1D9|nr:mechanosensitive ion channel domain-containing protein [Microbulbifer hainanensis]